MRPVVSHAADTLNHVRTFPKCNTVDKHLRVPVVIWQWQSYVWIAPKGCAWESKRHRKHNIQKSTPPHAHTVAYRHQERRCVHDVLSGGATKSSPQNSYCTYYETERNETDTPPSTASEWVAAVGNDNGGKERIIFYMLLVWLVFIARCVGHALFAFVVMTMFHH